MRIIAGTHRSRHILPPPDSATTRPITDRVKQALFDRLVAMEQMGGNVLDVFSGTGSLGLEALSRGADHASFVERDPAARELLERNIADLGFAERTSVLRQDAFTAAWSIVLRHKPLRLAFCDPPYKMTEDEREAVRVARLIESLTGMMEDDGLLVLRTSDHAAAMPVVGWAGPDTHEYGSMRLHFYRRG